MPDVVRWFIKTALLHFVLSLFIGVLLVAQSHLTLPLWIANLSPVYFHLLMVGWITQLIFGVSIWMFPPWPGEDYRYGPPAMIWSIYVLINLGLILRAVVEPVIGSGVSQGLWGWLLVLSALMQWSAAVCYLYIIWPRVGTK